MKTRINEAEFLVLTTFAALFFPLFQPYAGLILEQLLTLILSFISFMFLIKNNQRKIKTFSLVISCIYMSLLIISLLRSLDIFIINDLFELGKPVYFLLFFTLSYNINWDNTKISKYFLSLMGMLFVGALIGVGEALNPVFNNITSILYKDHRPVLAQKAVFSFIITYAFATVLLLPIFFYFIKIMRARNKSFLSDICKLLIFLACFLLTQSRTVFIGFVATFTILLILVTHCKWYPNRKKIITIISLLILGVIAAIPFIISYAQNNLKYLYHGLNIVISQFDNFAIKNLINSTPSISLRFEQVMFAIEHQDSIPLIGVGIGKKVFMPESFYAMYLYRVGLIGMFIHIGIVLYTIYWSLYFSKTYAACNTKTNNNFIMTAIFFSIAIYFISFFFDYFAAMVNDQTRSGFIFYVLVGMVCRYKKNHRIKKQQLANNFYAGG